jgi:FkbM family methyltransferase
MHLDYLQIGANIGDTGGDPIFKLLKETDAAILIEPVTWLYETLVTNYKRRIPNNNFIFLNIAISDHDGHLNLYVPSRKNDFGAFPCYIPELASVNSGHIEHHCSHGILVDTINVECKTLNSLIVLHNIESISNLVIDTEGHDVPILMNLDLTNIKPNNIYFENRHTDGADKRGEKYTLLINRLKDNGYRVVDETGGDTHVRLDAA